MSAERAEFVAADQHQLGVDPQLPEFCEQRVGGIGFVGQADLDVLGVARDLRVFETPSATAISLASSATATMPVDPGVAQAMLNRDEQLVDSWLSEGPPTRAGG